MSRLNVQAARQAGGAPDRPVVNRMSLTSRPAAIVATVVAVGAVMLTPGAAHATAPDRPVPLHRPAIAARGVAQSLGETRVAANTGRTPVLRPQGQRTFGALTMSPCADNPDFLCAAVPVPLDRSKASDPRILRIHVEVLPHTQNNRPSAGLIVISAGGPGLAVSKTKFGYLDNLLQDLPETFDIAFVDQRGLGQSGAILCPELQAAGAVPRYREAQKCRDQLGDTAGFYSSRDVADDLDDVRAALGVNKINLFGNSYAGGEAVTYAVRHRQHLRSIVVTSPEVTVGEDTFWPSIPESFPRIVNSLCARSASCNDSNADPAWWLSWLAASLRGHPLAGTWTDGDGVTHDVRLTETLLANWVIPNPQNEFAGPGEIAQAARAYSRGDPQPLLRLAGENDAPNMDVSGGDDPEFFSSGANLARRCADEPFPWRKDAPASVRSLQYATAWLHQPAKYGPIAKTAWAAPVANGILPIFPQPDPCIASRWTDVPAYPAGSTVPGVPALVMGGEYDMVVPTPEARRATDVLTDSTFVQIAGVFHNVIFQPGCAADLAVRFFKTLRVGDTNCAKRPLIVEWLPSAFPRSAATLPPAHPAAGTTAPMRLRTTATAAVWAVLDTIRHSETSNGVEPGLRGGTLTMTSENDIDVAVLDTVKFTDDVAVTGHVAFPTSDDVLDGDLTIVRGSDPPISLHLNGAWLDPASTRLSLSGAVGGIPVSLWLPAT